MLLGLFVILACQLAGDILVKLTNVPLPGAVVGIAILVCILTIKARFPANQKIKTEGVIEQTGDTLVRHMSLFFIPAAVGITEHFKLLKGEALPVFGILVISTAIILGITALLFSRLMKMNTRLDSK